MCGRYTITAPLSAINAAFGTSGTMNLAPRYNLAPTQSAPVVRRGAEGGRDLDMLSWGLVPHWAQDPSIASKLINARGESVAEKPAFRDAFARRRCLVPATGFFEWRPPPQGKGRKQPFLIRRRPQDDQGPPDAGVQHDLFAFAGLWARWRPKDRPDDPPLETFTIVTTAAGPDIAEIHSRQPVILRPEEAEAWLSGDAEAAHALIRPSTPGMVRGVPISTRVNAVAHDDPAVLEPDEVQPAKLQPTVLEPTVSPQPGSSDDPASGARRSATRSPVQGSLF